MTFMGPKEIHNDLNKTIILELKGGKETFISSFNVINAKKCV